MTLYAETWKTPNLRNRPPKLILDILHRGKPTFVLKFTSRIRKYYFVLPKGVIFMSIQMHNYNILNSPK